MSKTIIKLVKKINLNSNPNFKNSDEILETAISTINRNYSVPTEIVSWNQVKNQNSGLYTKILHSMSVETSYFLNQISNIPDLKDSLQRIEIQKDNYFFEFENDDIRQRKNHNIFIYFVSCELMLLNCISNKILVSYVPNEKNSNPIPFLIEMEENLSFGYYQEI